MILVTLYQFKCLSTWWIGMKKRMMKGFFLFLQTFVCLLTACLLLPLAMQPLPYSPVEKISPFIVLFKGLGQQMALQIPPYLPQSVGICLQDLSHKSPIYPTIVFQRCIWNPSIGWIGSSNGFLFYITIDKLLPKEMLTMMHIVNRKKIILNYWYVLWMNSFF